MTEPDRLIDPEAETEDNALDRAIRPRRLADYVGQPAVREQMDIFIRAARGLALAAFAGFRPGR
jgi:holliday junction DNA helicase RuvB